MEGSEGSEVPSAIISLNVGGVVFHTALATLQTSGMLSSMYGGDFVPSSTLDAMGRPFIDRSPKHFERILGCLRHGGAPGPLPDLPCEREELRLEAEYFGLHRLADALRAAEERSQERQRLEDRRLAAEAKLRGAQAALLDEAEAAEAAAAADIAATLEKLEGLVAPADRLRADEQGAFPNEPDAERRARQAQARRLIAQLADVRAASDSAAVRRTAARQQLLAVLGVAPGSVCGGGAVQTAQGRQPTLQRVEAAMRALRGIGAPRAAGAGAALGELAGPDEGPPGLISDDEDDELVPMGLGAHRARLMLAEAEARALQIIEQDRGLLQLRLAGRPLAGDGGGGQAQIQAAWAPLLPALAPGEALQDGNLLGRAALIAAAAQRGAAGQQAAAPAAQPDVAGQRAAVAAPAAHADVTGQLAAAAEQLAAAGRAVAELVQELRGQRRRGRGRARRAAARGRGAGAGGPPQGEGEGDAERGPPGREIDYSGSDGDASSSESELVSPPPLMRVAPSDGNDSDPED